MTIVELGALGEFFGSIVVVVTLVYLAIQVRQNTAHQKREETVSIQRGQNAVVSQMSDPDLVRAWVRTADGDIPASVEDRSRAIIWVIQYLNQFQIVYDLYHDGTLDAERYELWESIAISIVACRGIRTWWEAESGKLGFMPKVRARIDQKLPDTTDPPIPWNKVWSIFTTEAWEQGASTLGGHSRIDPQAPAAQQGVAPAVE
ncbi:MAG: hypothetical protein ACYS0K_24390 [Planctomycetota bacterium]|jgi:hypothetical protein